MTLDTNSAICWAAVMVTGLVASAALECEAAPVKYRVVPAGTIDGKSGDPTGINAQGDMVGALGGSNTVPPIPFLYQNGFMNDLRNYGLSSAESINDRGQVTGTRNAHPYIYENGSVTDLGTVGHLYANARSINSLGQVVGIVTDESRSETWKPFLYHDGVEIVLPTPANGQPVAINDRGQIVGTTVVGPTVIHPFLYDDGRVIDLGTLGGVSAWASAINRFGAVAGTSWTSEGQTRAFRYSKGAMADLGALTGAFYPYNAYSDAYAINDNDQIVGESSSHAFLWQDGVLHDLNDLLADGYAHWMIVRATGINNAGQIAARGCPNLQLIQCGVVRLDPEGVPAVSKPTSVEFYNAALDHYFMTASPADIAVLDTGRLAGWRRTGGQFNVWTSGDPQSSPVCRYYIPPAHGDSHFFSASAEECSIAPTLFPWLVSESPAAFNIHLPDPGSGACPSGDIPVYRVWNQRFDSNHRYTINWIARDWMIANGSVAEGTGVPKVAMCAQ